MSVVADLRAEQADLRALVEDADLHAATPAQGWDVQDCLAHLIGFDAEELRAAADPDGFLAMLPAIVVDVPAFMDGLVLSRRGLGREQLLGEWQAGFDAMVAALEDVPEGTRVPWYGPPMSARSALTARLMEYWAHGQDIADGLGALRPATDRLRHVCHLGVRTRQFSYVNRALPVPDGDVRVELEAPSGETWTWGEGPDAVRGPALDFCLLVTQRRHRADLALTATGPLADSWLDVAQCFAGPPGPGRPRGRASRD